MQNTIQIKSNINQSFHTDIITIIDQIIGQIYTDIITQIKIISTTVSMQT